MIRRSPIDVTLLRQTFGYDPLTGVLRWLETRCARAQAGQPAGGLSGRGYVTIFFDGRAHMAHRLAWAHVHGECPEHLDHINGDGTDNRLANLRPCTQSTNNRNMSTRRNKRSTLKGVTLWRRGGWQRWRARIVVDKREISLGYFATEQEAHAAYMAAAKVHFGEFARAA